LASWNQTAMATKSSILHPLKETENSVSRITREGKNISYTLRVIQQPERARACGAGARSSADRRPVDPPPVVELRIFEIDPNNDLHKTDITFGYNANFFLFATLESARPIAHGRVQGQPSSCPVLTGVPVAGIAYLDRPSQAGYFIFPDLSVRHEGLYRLHFNLYEEMKDAKDEDKNAAIPIQETLVPSVPSKPRAPIHFLHFRLEVKSTAFTVFSAKKFPGLSESTSLSRIVAEQGCRVRIRRDVRMRRREPKVNKEYGYDSRHMTPDVYPGTPVERPRSVSNTSIDEHFRYAACQHQPSVPDFGYHNHPPFQQHPTGSLPGPPPAPTNQSHLSFGSAQPQYQAPHLSSQHSAPPATYPPPCPDYSHARQTSTGSEYDSHKFPQHPPPSPSPQIESVEQPKTSLPPSTVPMDPPTSSNAQSCDPEASQSTAQVPRSDSPCETVNNDPQPVMATSPVLTMDLDTLNESPISPGRPSPSFEPAHGKGRSYETDPIISSKRSHAEVFGSADEEQPLRDGKRPDTPSEQDPENKQDMELLPDGEQDDSIPLMMYKRADGRQVTIEDQSE